MSKPSNSGVLVDRPVRPTTARRTVLKGSAVAGALGGASVLGMSAPAFARAPGKRVTVLGGGMAGLTAAHELAERGLQVTVFEPTAWGGKARSIPVAGMRVGPRRNLPGEHGFRFRSEEPTSELPSLMRISYAVLCL